MSYSPKSQYEEDLLAPDFIADPVQAMAIDKLDTLYQQLSARNNRSGISKLFSTGKPIKGLYLWGGVGTGKSYLMDTFYHCLEFEQKCRLHFHEYMQRIQAELNELKGQRNPMKIIAKRWAKEYQVLCFDEFFVKDIGDAMLLANLLTELFDLGVTLVVTSNVEPQNLYKNGLQRERFLPAIKVLCEHVEMMHVDNDVDYRQLHHKPAEVFFSPLDNYAKQMMMQSYHYYAGLGEGDITDHDDLMINHRLLPVIRHSKKVAWFSFNTLCNTPRSSQDYLALAKQFAVIMLSDIPILASHMNDPVVRFINLIDVLYDQHICLIASMAVPVEQLYTGGKWAFEFQRTVSRLQEMQSEQYCQECELEA